MVFTSDLLPCNSEGVSRLRPTFALPTNSFWGIFLAVLEILFTFASNNKRQMKKIIIFYIVCCISHILLGLASNYEQIGTRDFRFGFSVFVILVTLIYIPICTIIAGIMYYSKINRKILSNILYGIIYCLFPTLLLELAEVLGHKANFNLNCIKSDYIFYEIFAIQNLLIIGYGITKRFWNKKCKKE